MIPKNIKDITKVDIDFLITNATLEGKTLEYKEKLPDNSDSEKKEFLADVSSFANSIGGDLIFGIETKDGNPVKIKGISVANIDSEISRIENIIRDGIYPRIKCHILSIETDDSKAILIRVDQSWISPHRVIFKNWGKFFARNSNGKYEMDVEELRTSFNLSDSISQKITNFRMDRIAKIISGDAHLPMLDGAKISVHLIPLQAFISKSDLAIGAIRNLVTDTNFKPMRSYGWSWIVNLNGVATYCKGEENKAHTYTQFYRNGIIEAVDQSMLEQNAETKTLPMPYQTVIQESVEGYLKLQQKLGINTPIFVFITLIGVGGYKIGYDRFNYTYDDDHPIKERDLLLPEVSIEDFNVDVKKALAPIFELVWNATGIIVPPKKE